jgi:HlyD family secretion protein
MNERRLIPLAAVLGLVVFLGILTWVLFPRHNDEISASGTIEATEVVVSSKVGATVLKVLVREGDKVNKGDVIAQLDDLELSALYKQAKANSVLAANNLNRVKELSQKGFASPQTLDEAKANFDAAQANGELALIKLRDATIKAPLSGYVMVRSIEEGELATAGSPIVTIADILNVHMIVYVSERQVGRIKLGNTAFIFSDSFPNERFEGRVTYISNQAEFTPKTIQTKEERVTQVFAVKVEVENLNLKLKPGLPADAVIKI